MADDAATAPAGGDDALVAALERECAALKIRAATADARIRREVDAAVAIAAERATEEDARLEARLVERALEIDRLRVALDAAETRAARAEGAHPEVRARHARETAAAVDAAVRAERARGVEALRLAAVASSPPPPGRASSAEQDALAAALGMSSRTRAETVAAREDAEAAARQNVGAAIVAEAMRASDEVAAAFAERGFLNPAEDARRRGGGGEARLGEDRELLDAAADLEDALATHARASGVAWGEDADLAGGAWGEDAGGGGGAAAAGTMRRAANHLRRAAKLRDASTARNGRHFGA